MSRNVALIMAGGSGTRFWPKSRAAYPKQFLPFFDGQSLMQLTVRRLEKIVGPENVFIIMGERYVKPLLDQVPGFPQEQLILEPCARDTAAAIGLAAVVISRLRPGATMVVAPADHLIKDEDKFAALVDDACALARRTGSLLTIGIPPREPSSAYGYVEAGDKIDREGQTDAFEVRGFKEKPSTEVARRYLELGSYLWNSGIFVWQASAILEEMATHLPEVHGPLMEINAAFDGGGLAETIRRVFPEIHKISVDYGVLEKTRNILTLKGTFFWDDLGSWTAYAAYLAADAAGNKVSGRAVLDGCRDCLVLGDDEGLVACAGVKDLIVVRTGDAVLVCDRRDDQAVKRLVEQLKAIEGGDGYI